MQSTTVVLILVCLAREVLCCEPCKCAVDSTGRWSGLQVSRCDDVQKLNSVPSTDTLPDYTQVLYIIGGSITTIIENQFVSFKKLEYIHVDKSQVTKVESHAFRNMTNVIKISLVNNLIMELPVGIFLDTPSLVELKLYGNKLKVLPKNFISNLKYLQLVKLDANQITSIEANCFMNVPRLETLFLKDNKLTSLNLNIIDNPSSLKLLTLYSNPWHCDESLCGVMAAVVSRQLWGTSFVKQHGTWTIPSCASPQNLQWKRWDELKEHALLRQCPPPNPCRLEGPSVARCSAPLSPARVPDTLPSNITHLHITDQKFTTLANNAFSSYGQLQDLHLERNNINSIEPNALLNLMMLSDLYLGDNKLIELPTTLFTPTPNLKRILLNKNNLTRLSKFQFSNLVRLQEVDLSFNNISFIEKECFINVSSLRIINLSNNQLQTLQLNVMDSAISLERLYVEGNPWRCDEALCGVLDAVVGGPLWGAHTEPECTAPPPLAGKSWSELPQYFHPYILILDSNQYWVRASRATSVLAARELLLQCRYCFVSRVTWTLNGVKLPRSYQRTSQEALISTLIMENVQKYDEGDYVCHGSQCPGCDTAWIRVTVNTTLPDTRGLKQDSYMFEDEVSIEGPATADVGEQITLQCASIGSQYLPVKYWIYWKVPVPENKHTEILQVIKLKSLVLVISIIKINIISNKDEGDYKCHLNDDWYDEASAHVYVNDMRSNADAPRIYSSTEGEVQINAGANITLRCESPRPVTWTRRQVKKSYNIEHNLNVGGQYVTYLHLTEANYEDAGLHHCLENNSVINHPFHSNSIFIFVKDAQHLYVLEKMEDDLVYPYSNVTVPCLPTSRDVNVSLSMLHEPFDRYTRRYVIM